MAKIKILLKTFTEKKITTAKKLHKIKTALKKI